MEQASPGTEATAAVSFPAAAMPQAAAVAMALAAVEQSTGLATKASQQPVHAA
jgi:hypothetical protein